MHRIVVIHSPRHLKTSFKQNNIWLWTRLSFISLLEKTNGGGENGGGGGGRGKTSQLCLYTNKGVDE